MNFFHISAADLGVASVCGLMLVRPSSDQQGYSFVLNCISSARDSKDKNRSFLILCSALQSRSFWLCAPLAVGGLWGWRPFHGYLHPSSPGWGLLCLSFCFLSAMATSWIPKICIKTHTSDSYSKWKPESLGMFLLLSLTHLLYDSSIVESSCPLCTLFLNSLVQSRHSF